MGLNFLLYSYYHNLITQPILSSYCWYNLTSVLHVHHHKMIFPKYNFYQALLEKSIKHSSTYNIKPTQLARIFLIQTHITNRSYCAPSPRIRLFPLFFPKSSKLSPPLSPPPTQSPQRLTFSICLDSGPTLHRSTGAYKQKVLGCNQETQILTLLTFSGIVTLGRLFEVTVSPDLFLHQYNEILT